MAENTVKASLSNYRVSAQKARLVANQIRGKGVEEALNLLDLSPKRIAGPIAKLVRSAVANAEQKNENQHAGIEIDDLVVSTIYVDEGPSMWRIRPRAGTASATTAPTSARRKSARPTSGGAAARTSCTSTITETALGTSRLRGADRAASFACLASCTTRR